MRGVDYNWVADFVRVVRAGSFTAAARDLDLPKSSLSRTIASLERAVGVRLLHRTTRKLALTEIGQEYFESVRGSFEALDAATSRAADHDANPRGLVRITAPSDFVGLPEELTKFMRKHPGIQVQTHLAARYMDLVAEGIDLAIRIGRLEDSSLIATKLGDVQIGLVAAESYLRRRGRPASIDDLASHDWILYRAHGLRSVIELTGPAGERSIEVEGALIADEMSFCRAACEAGAGIARLPLHEDRLERILPDWSAGSVPAWILTAGTKLLPRRVALLRDHLSEHLPKHLPGHVAGGRGRKRVSGPEPR